MKISLLPKRGGLLSSASLVTAIAGFLLLQWVTLVHGQIETVEIQWPDDPATPRYSRAELGRTLIGTGAANSLEASFEVQSGDRFTFHMESLTGVTPVVRILDPSRAVVLTDTGSSRNWARIQNWQPATPGTYAVQFYFTNGPADFTALAQRSEGLQFESEPNNDTGNPVILRIEGTSGTATHQAAGLLDNFDTGDIFDLGYLGPAADLQISLTGPAGSRLEPSDIRLSLLREGEPTPVTTSQNGALNHLVTVAGMHYLRVDLTGPDGYLDLDGSGWVDFGNPAILQQTGDQTIEFWAKADALNSRRNPWAKAYAGEGTLTMETDGTLNYFYGTGGGNNSPYQSFNSSYRVPEGLWTHYALVRDLSAAEPKVRWYINGQLSSEADAPYPAAVAGGLSAFIGQGYTSRFVGAISQVRIWNTALSASEIQSGMNLLTQNLSDTSDLAAGWDFTFSENSILDDLSINNADGILSGTATLAAESHTTPLTWAHRGSDADYFLSLALTDNAPMEVVANSLPAEGVPSQDLLFSFSFDFTNDLSQSSVEDASNFLLEGAGDDNLFGTEDDVAYTLSPGLSDRNTVHVSIVEAPLLPGNYRLTITTGLTDRLGNSLAGNFIRTFSVEGVGDYLPERQPNNSFATATPVQDFTGSPSGSFLGGSSLSGGDRLWDAKLADLDLDGNLDIVAISEAGSLYLYEGAGNGTFADPVIIALATYPRGLLIDDIFANGRPDIAISCRSADRVLIFENTDNPDFAARMQPVADIPLAPDPQQLDSGDFNEDGHRDILVAHEFANSTSLLVNDGSGAFSVVVLNTPATGTAGAIGLAAADFNEDGLDDFVLSHHRSREIQVYLGDGSGNFSGQGAIPVSTANREPAYIAVDDINEDGSLDLVLAYNYNDRFDVFSGDGTGGLASAHSVHLGGFYYQHDVTVVDQGLDPDLILLGGSSGLFVVQSRPTGSDFDFENSRYANTTSSYGGDYGDLDKDGLGDLIAANYGNDRVEVLLGLQSAPLLPDESVSGEYSAILLRGLLREGELDHYQFSVEGPKRFVLAVQTTNPEIYLSRVRLRIYDAGFNEIGTVNSGVSGTENFIQLELPHPGTYFIRVEHLDNYHGEYRMRLSAFDPELQWESENNNATNQADAVALTPTIEGDLSQQEAILWAFHPSNENVNGDFYRLPNLGPGTTIAVDIETPENSPLNVEINYWDGGNSLILDGAPASFGQSLELADPVNPPFYIQVDSDESTRGLLSDYRMQITLTDTTPPVITGNNLPVGSTEGLPNTFSITFNEDMLASTVNDPVNYEMRGAGMDGVLETPDDVIYTLGFRSTYGSQFTHTLYIDDGPLSPGEYRFTAFTGIRDRFGNPLAENYTHTFTVTAAGSFLLESEPNDTRSNSFVLGSTGTSFGGSFNSDPIGDSPTQDRPWRMVLTDLNGDTVQDLALVASDNNLQVFLGNGAGGFFDPANFPIGGGSGDVVAGDLTGDGRPEIVLSHPGGRTIVILENTGDDSLGAESLFSVSSTINTGRNPRQLALGELNGDGDLDIVAADYDSGAILLLSDGTGGFVQSLVAAPGRAYGIVIGEFTGDAHSDFALSVHSVRELHVFQNDGGGSFTAFQQVPAVTTNRNLYYLDKTDFNQDNVDDILLAYDYNDGADVFPGDPNGGFEDPFRISLGGFVYSYSIRAADYNGDGWEDILLARSDGFQIFTNSQDNSDWFPESLFYSVGPHYDLDISDITGDSLPDVIGLNYNSDKISVYGGFPIIDVPADPGPLDLKRGIVRGMISDAQDHDFHAFQATAGDRIQIVTQSFGTDYYQRVRLRIHDPGGSEITTFASNIQERMSVSVLEAPMTGRYFVRVENLDNFFGEYRLRVSIFGGSLPNETESNNSLTQADLVAFEEVGLTQVGGYYGSLPDQDTSGDYYRLGNLGTGTLISLETQLPDATSVSPVLQIFDPAGLVVATGTPGGTVLDYTIPPDAAGNYSVRIYADGNSEDFFAEYALTVTLQDGTPPEITGDTLPEEGSSFSTIFDRFNLTFSEDLEPSTVNETANYELHSSGPDGIFGSDDDEVYSILLQAVYQSGLGASYLIPDGPLQPGDYRLVISGLEDLSENVLSAAFIRQWSVEAVPDVLFEDRSNDSIATADMLSSDPTDTFDGSFAPVGFSIATGDTPWVMEEGDFTGDGIPDVAIIYYTPGLLRVYPGTAGGGLGDPIEWTTAANPYHLLAGDWNKDGRTDLLVSHYGSNLASVYLSIEDPSVFSVSDIALTHNQARQAATGDFNNDSHPDIVIAHYSPRQVTLMLGDGAGNFAVSYLDIGSRFNGVAVADFNHDGLNDIVLGSDSPRELALYVNLGGAVFEQIQVMDGLSANPFFLEAGDVDGDGRADLAVAFQGGSLGYLYPGGESGLGTPYPLSFGRTTNSYAVHLEDINLDGSLDLVWGGEGALGMGIHYNNTSTPGQWAFSSIQGHPDTGNSYNAAVLEFPAADPILVIASYSLDTIFIREQQTEKPLRNDPANSRIREIEARGNLVNSSDVDYFSFSGRAGESVHVTTRRETSNYYSRIRVRLYDPQGTEIHSFISRIRGENSTSEAVKLPFDGTYFVRVENLDQDRSGYRLRVTSFAPDIELESKNNNSTAQSDPIPFGHLETPGSARVGGFLLGNSVEGDYWSMSNIGEGTSLTITAQPIQSSPLNPQVEIRDSTNQVVAHGTGETVSWIAPADYSGDVYVRIFDDSSLHSIASSYVVDIDLVDTTPPQITSTTLPSEPTTGLIQSFTLNFNEELDPSTVTELLAYELRKAAVPGLWGPEDTLLTVIPPNYTGGLSGSYGIQETPLGPGFYRFTVNSTLSDRWGNSLSESYVQTFEIVGIDGYQTEVFPNDTPETAVAVLFSDRQADYQTGGLRGAIQDASDLDYWTFEATAGERLIIDGRILPETYYSRLRFRVFAPDSSELLIYTSGVNNNFAPQVVELSQTGQYSFRVERWDNFLGEYQIWLSKVAGDLQIEEEPNGGIIESTSLPFEPLNANTDAATAAGTISGEADLDYFDLGTIGPGKTVFLSVRLPDGSPLNSVVGIYNDINNLLPEVEGSPADDSVAEVEISQSGRYLAVVGGVPGTGGVQSSYLLEIQIVPTDSFTYPNLVVDSVQAIFPVNPQSGESFTYSVTVRNGGSQDIPAGGWSDRVVLSPNSIAGDADDIVLDAPVRSAGLAVEETYDLTGSGTIPEGFSGNLYFGVNLDVSNLVNEFVFENDNSLLTDSPFLVELKDYPDLVAANLSSTPIPDTSNWLVEWSLSNRGSGSSPDGTSMRLLVTRSGSVELLVNEVIDAGTGLAPNASRAFSRTIAASEGGSYLVRIITDSANDVYEFNANGHASAEQNTFETQFAITSFYDVFVTAFPVAGGNVTGSGNYAQGSEVTVTATPDTATLPFFFSRWTENGAFVSADSNYTFPASRNRDLVAEFLLPSYPITLSANPGGSGSLNGSGNFAHGSPVSVSASPSAGYTFTHWEESGNPVSTDNPYEFTAISARSLVAIFEEANPEHILTVATDPQGVASIPGAGVFGNGISLNLPAPPVVVDGDTEYLFERWLLNGQVFSLEPTVSLVLTTANPPAMDFVAVYGSRSLKPVVENAFANRNSPIPSGLETRFTVVFDRPMDTQVIPVGILLSDDAAIVASLPAGGSWLNSRQFRFADMQFGEGNSGDYRLQVSSATDLDNRVMDPAEVFVFSVDTDPPQAVTLALEDYAETTADLSWAGYPAPPDLLSFRVFVQESPFSSTNGLSAAAAPSGNSRTARIGGLELDTTYYAAVIGVDRSGNGLTEVTPFEFTTSSDIPAPIDLIVQSTGPDEATLDWSAYPESSYRGFESYAIYQASSPFFSVTGLAPIETLPSGQQRLVIKGLERTEAAYFAVVGINRLGQFNPNVQSEIWEDPLSGTITNDFTFGPGVVDVLQLVTVSSGADLKLLPGTVLRFAEGAGIIVEEGRLLAEGTVLRPILFTSMEDDGEGAIPAAGDWGQIILSDPLNASILEHVGIRFGSGLILDGSSPMTDTLSVLNSDGAGILVRNEASLAGGPFFLIGNAVGIYVDATSSATVNGSVLKNNAVQVSVENGSTQNFVGNWWGTSDTVAISNSWTGPVNGGLPLGSEPVLSNAIAPVGNTTTTGSLDLELLVGSLNAESVRISEDSSFNGVLFEDLLPDPVSGGVFRFSSETVPLKLSEGAGTKILYAQFRSLTGELTDPIQLLLEYITEGPVISAFSLSEGQLIERPIQVSATASAILGIASLALEVDGERILHAEGGSLDATWDVREFTSGIRTVRLVATDSAGNLATRTLNVTLSPRPPQRPTLDAPQNGALLNSTPVSARGFGEPGSSIRLMRNAQAIGTTTAGSDGAFSFEDVPLVEGVNEITAVAFDILGSNVSPTVRVSLDTIVPATLILEPPTFDPDSGLQLLWRYPEEGKRAATFRTVWSDVPFTSIGEANGQSEVLEIMQYFLRGIPDGTYFIGVVGYDLAGNVSEVSNLIEYDFDASAPVFTIDYDQNMPTGQGDLQITLSSNEPILGTPKLTVRPDQFRSPLSVPLNRNSPNDFSASYSVTDLSARTGVAQVVVSARDLRGNTFNGNPMGPILEFDITRPQGTVAIGAEAPIQIKETVTLSLSLQLTEPPVGESIPGLSFIPPQGDPINILLSGSNLSWSGSLSLGPAQGDGTGTFVMDVTDLAGNTGTTITSGAQLELYTSDLPTAPEPPVGLIAETLPGGEIKISWDAVDLAESYAIYRAQGMAEDPPATLLLDNLTGTEFTDLPSEDGVWSYVVTAERRGSESLPSGILPGNSDRTPPEAPTGVEAELLRNGVLVTWTASVGEVPARYRIYRNGEIIRTVQSASGITDSPPKGVSTYQVAAVDPYGNESISSGAQLEFFVDAISGLTATIQPEAPPRLSWTSSDSNAVAFLVERNGVSATNEPVQQTFFVDTVVPEAEPIVYTVRALTADNQESAPRSITVFPFTMQIGINTAPGLVAETPAAFYFDEYGVSILNTASSGFLNINRLRFERSQSGVNPIQQELQTNVSVLPDSGFQRTIVFPAASTRGVPQELKVQAFSGPDPAGATVIYETTATVPASVAPNGTVSIAVDEAPLAGGLTNFNLSIRNRGYAPMQIVYNRDGGAAEGDIYVSVVDEAGVEVSRHYSQGLLDGLLVQQNGDGLLLIQPGETVEVPVDNVLVPETLGADGYALFRGVVETLYNGVGTGMTRRAGPISGQVSSNLAETPYYGTSSTTKQIFANAEDVVLTGRALDRDTNQPVADSPLKIGISSGGFRWFEEVVTDDSGDYIFTYSPPPGFSGTLNFWACHPDIFDTLEQTSVSFYRMYITPNNADIVMSLSDTLDFNLQLINPGDVELSGFTLDTRAYILDGETEVPTDQIILDFNGDPPATLEKRARKNVSFRLTSTLDTPEDPIVEFTLSSAEGAEVEFRGRVSLKPAVPILSTIDPENGYVDVSLNGGELRSEEVTVRNLGLRPLENPELVAPAGIDWFLVRYEDQLPDESGLISLPDIPVGGEVTFTVIFNPPEDAELGFVDDFLLIRGSNAQSDFQLNLFAQVTTDETGSVDFYVDNILVDPVPNASIRLRNPTLRMESGPFTTDVTGSALVEGLQEGVWSWQIVAPGHSTQSGTIEVIANQTVDVRTRLSRSLVTVDFSVVPKPFTDRYEIVIEQTFETRVPFPVLVLSPPNFEFTNPEPGFETIVIVEARNEGLVSLFDGEIEGSAADYGSATPLITYVPELRAQEVIEIPFRIRFLGKNGEAGAGGSAQTAGTVETTSFGQNFGTCLSTLLLPNSLDPDVLLGLAAIMNAGAQCADGVAAAVAASLAIGFDIYSAVSTLASPYSVLATVVGCAIGSILAALGIGQGGGSFGGDGGGPGDDGGPNRPGSLSAFGTRTECFPDYALVEMVDGSHRPISEVEEGMWVRSGESRFAKAQVQEVIRLESEDLLKFELVAMTDPSQRMDFHVTREHKVWTDSSGWLPAMYLKEGDLLHGRNEILYRVERIQEDSGAFAVFTLDLENANSLYVDGILVQDLCGPGFSKEAHANVQE